MGSNTQIELEREKFRSIQEIARAVGSTFDLEDLLHLVVGKITEMMKADRSTLYVMDESRTGLWTKVLQANELREIRLKVGEGIAGWVAKTGKTANIEDAYQDPRFSRQTDQLSGYRTQSILCVPMNDNLGNIIGVIQVLNKIGGVFTADDEELLKALASQASIAIENSQLYISVIRNNQQLLQAQEELERRMQELDLLLEIEHQINAATFLDELLEGVLVGVSEFIGAEAASVVIRDEQSDKLFFRNAVGHRREAIKQYSVALGEGIAGWVAMHGKPAIVTDPTSDPRHNVDLANMIDFHPRNILCVPLVGQDTVIGAIELLNKIGREEFDEGDLTLLTLVAGRAVHAIEFARIKEKRIQESRLASIGQMMSSVLHDFKTPMTIVSGYAQLMAECSDEKTRKEHANQILRQFDLLSAMTREVLAFARGESNVLIRKVYLNIFLGEIEEALKLDFSGKNIKFTMDARYKGLAHFDESKFRRIFHNIGRNAAEAMPNGGEFHIVVDKVEDRLVIEFKDTGPGIPKEIEGRVFDTFATVGKKGGTGLGLAIVKKIVDEHQGVITYSSSAGEGTTFIVSLPLMRGDVTSGEVSVGKRGQG
ncbi:MAG: GAF domain-containing sensor histidine kinase [Pseudomonadota bacterium]